MDKSLIIGNTSQLSYYFPSNYDRISSRNIDISKIKKSNYNEVFILFAEQRTFLNEDEGFFLDVNFHLTIKIIESIKNYVNKIILYSTSELWNNYEGKVSLFQNYNYNYTPYIKSKHVLCDYINENKEKYPNVFIIYPFNFNSPYRKNGFLFNKIFDSLINKKINYIGNIDFDRDLIHPYIIVKESFGLKENKLVGSGELINLKKFVCDIFKLHNMNYEEYLIEKNEQNLTNVRKNYMSDIKYSDYNELLNLTIKDLHEYKISQRHNR